MPAPWLLYHIASGQAFFSGAGFLLAAVAVSPWVRRGWLRVVRNLGVGLGGILIAISGTPLPVAFYGLLILALLGWIGAESRRGRLSSRLLGLGRGGIALAALGGVIAEAPHHILPRVPPLGRPVLGVIGDSITAGTDDSDDLTWPRSLSERFGVEVRDHAKAGATVASALGQAAAVKPDERLVLVEIGGNDLLGGTTPEAFEAGLARLLAATCRAGRVVVMLELPLPPGSNRYGATQRRLARQFGVLLVPKRVLIGLLLRGGATLDTIHLSPEGHRRMADTLWEILRPAFDDSKPLDRR